MSLPKIIYVREDKERDGTVYPIAFYQEDDLSNGDNYAVYERKEKRKMIVEYKPIKVK